MEIIVIGAGPAGIIAARRAANLGAKTTLVTRDELGGLAVMTDRFQCAHWPMPRD